jgi:hypothetical protein
VKKKKKNREEEGIGKRKRVAEMQKCVACRML